jgi:biopolymer transport protein ExbB
MVELLRFWFEAGGPIVMLLAALSVFSLALILAKAAQLVPARAGGPGRSAAIAAWGTGATGDALARIAGGRAPADRVMSVAMHGLLAGHDEVVLRGEIEAAGSEELDALGSQIRFLELIAVIAPLLGLLGTVLGMIESFRSLELAGGAANASVLAGGVWTALLTTAMGLIVAIPAAVAAGLFSVRIDRVARDIEVAVAHLFAAERDRAGR